MPFSAPYRTVRIGDNNYMFTADVHAYFKLHMLMETDPDRFVIKRDEQGNPVSGAMDWDPDHAPSYFHCFHPQLTVAQWERICAEVHPEFVVNAWRVANTIMAEAEWQRSGGPAEEPTDPFCPEPEEPVEPAGRNDSDFDDAGLHGLD